MQNGLSRISLYLISLLLLTGCQLTANDIKDQDGLVEPAAATEVTEPVQEAAESPAPIIDQQRLEQIEAEMRYKKQLESNIWLDLQQSFSWHHPENKAIRKEINRYLRHRSPLQTLNQNAAPHLYFIVSELKKRNLPTELALLPHVESNFDPFAYSHGGAAGLWQFMPGTARHYGLASNWWYEGRRDPYASTMAALDYLQYLVNFFDGDWLLAVAAYNAGEGRVKQAVKRNKKRHKPTDFWSLSLPAETRVYVPRLLAITELVSNPKKYDLQLPVLVNMPQLATVETNGQLELAIAAELADMPLADFHRINAGFNRWATAPNNPHPLLIPVAKQAEFKQKLARLPEDKRITWQRYQVKKGDSLGLIAQNFNTSVGVLQTVNKLNGNMIRIGQALMIPRGNFQGKTPFRTEIFRSSSKKSQGKIVYRVKSGDNLWKIAKKFDVAHKDIARWNGISSKALLKPGKKLTIYNKRFRKGKTTQYRVKNGDSLYLIAKRFKISVKKLTDWNDLNLNNYLQPGQMLKIYL